MIKVADQLEIIATYSATAGIKVTAGVVQDNISDMFRQRIIERKDSSFLYFIARAVTADVPNKNHDMFPLDEIKAHYMTFVDRCLFMDHNAKKVENAVGKVVAAELRQDDKGETYVACLCRVDRWLQPHICRMIEAGTINSVSMGANVGSSTCSKCNNVATKESDFCLLPGTLVATKGFVYKPIESLQVGDIVITHTGEERPVEKTFVRDVDETVYTIKSAFNTRAITTTGNHPFGVATPLGLVWKQAKDLTTKDWLYQPMSKGSVRASDIDVLRQYFVWMNNQYFIIKSIEESHYTGKVYNIAVADHNSYIAEGVVVHNCDHQKNPAMYDSYSINHEVEFTELSLVSVPADPTAKMSKVFDLQHELTKTATDSVQSTSPMAQQPTQTGLKAEHPVNESVVVNLDGKETPFYQVDCSSTETSDLLFNIFHSYLNKGIDELTITGRCIKLKLDSTIEDFHKFFEEILSQADLFLAQGTITKEDLVQVRASIYGMLAKTASDANYDNWVTTINDALPVPSGITPTNLIIKRPHKNNYERSINSQALYIKFSRTIKDNESYFFENIIEAIYKFFGLTAPDKIKVNKKLQFTYNDIHNRFDNKGASLDTVIQQLFDYVKKYKKDKGSEKTNPNGETQLPTNKKIENEEDKKDKKENLQNTTVKDEDLKGVSERVRNIYKELDYTESGDDGDDGDFDALGNSEEYLDVSNNTKTEEQPTDTEHKTDGGETKQNIEPTEEVNSEQPKENVTETKNNEAYSLLFSDNVKDVQAAIRAGADINAKDKYGFPALIKASYKGHLEVVQELIKAGADVNAKDIDGYTALMRASRHGHLEVVKELIKAKADVNEREKYGMTALMWASEEGYLEIVKELIELGADVNAKDKYGQTALRCASTNDHLEVVKELIKVGADINAKDKNGYTALSYTKDDKIKAILEQAMQSRQSQQPDTESGTKPKQNEEQKKVNPDTVQPNNTKTNTIQKEDKPNHAKRSTKTPKDLNAFIRSYFNSGTRSPKQILVDAGIVNPILQYTLVDSMLQSLITGNPLVIPAEIKNDENKKSAFTKVFGLTKSHVEGSGDGSKLLEEAKAAAKQESTSQEDIPSTKEPLNEAKPSDGSGEQSGSEQSQSVSGTQPKVNNDSKKHKLLFSPKIEDVQAAIESGADVNTKDKDGWTALMYASWKDYLNIAQVLIKAGADVSVKDNDGRTALLIASEFGHLEVAQELIQAGADVNVKDNNGKMALTQAIEYKRSGIVKALIAAGADVNAKDKDGWTALMYASKYGDLDMVKAAIAAGADVNATNKNGLTSLMYASKGGHSGIIQELIKAKADINVKNAYGQTALISACANSHLEVVQMLIQAGADVKATDKDGYTALDFAKDGKIKDILEQAMQSGQSQQQTGGDKNTGSDSNSYTGTGSGPGDSTAGSTGPATFKFEDLVFKLHSISGIDLSEAAKKQQLGKEKDNPLANYFNLKKDKYNAYKLKDNNANRVLFIKMFANNSLQVKPAQGNLPGVNLTLDTTDDNKKITATFFVNHKEDNKESEQKRVSYIIKISYIPGQKEYTIELLQNLLTNTRYPEDSANDFFTAIKKVAAYIYEDQSKSDVSKSSAALYRALISSTFEISNKDDFKKKVNDANNSATIIDGEILTTFNVGGDTIPGLTLSYNIDGSKSLIIIAYKNQNKNEEKTYDLTSSSSEQDLISDLDKFYQDSMLDIIDLYFKKKNEGSSNQGTNNGQSTP